MSERVTRSKTGKTPSKPYNPGFVETPGRKRGPRKSVIPSNAFDSDEYTPPPSRGLSESVELPPRGLAASNGALSNGDGAVKKDVNGYANGHANEVTDPKIDTTGQFEFGGSLGVSAMMIGFPLLMYYMWIGATFYDGHFPKPVAGESFSHFLEHMWYLVRTEAYPHRNAWLIYWTFFITEGIFYLCLPGIYCKGKALPHLGGKQLDYYCSGVWSFYVTIVLALTLHFTGLFKLYTLIDEFGPIMSVAIISGFAVSVLAYFSALHRGAQHRMTGYPLYDFFMGAELNPRMFGWLDFKMFFEVRLPWYILFLLSLGTAARQYENHGYVSGEVGFILMAHFLYANACSKGEHLITTSWDMYYEKWGFMLIFWNLAGVPLSYCHCTIYLASHAPEVYRWPRWALVALAAAYLFAYWVWDTCNSQKNMFRQEERGAVFERKTFPWFSYGRVRNPKSIPTRTGDSILCDGW
ncbi:hypothetical protein AOQ84DRAFT_328669, partial [Glonium stellatum]